MLNVRKPKARTLGSSGFTISIKEDPIVHSPVTDADDSYENPFVAKTPGSDRGSAFEPVGPPEIRRKVRAEDHAELASVAREGSSDRRNFATPERTAAGGGKKADGSRCDTTQATSPRSRGPPPPAADGRRRKGAGTWGRGAAFKNQLRQIRSNLPRALRAAGSGASPGEGCVDLADLAVAAVCIVPRHGAGMAVGRKPFERMRTSLMLHMVRENENASWGRDAAGGGAETERDPFAKLNALLRNCIAEETCFVEKSQEAVRLARNTLEELNDGGGSHAKTEIGRRNLTCVKFLSGMYREVIGDGEDVPSRDGLSSMVVAGACYAVGKFEPALSAYQRAGIELKKKISTSPEHTVHCAKLFNNMGCVYFEMNKYEKAMQSFQRALQLFHDDDGGDHAAWSAAISDQASIMNNMAYVLIKFKQYDDASGLVDASFELQQLLPAGHTNATTTISTLSTMAFIYYRTKQYKNSLDTYTACVQLQDRSPMCSECDQVEVLKKMADICKKIDDHEKRVYLLRTILVYQQCYLLEDDDEIWDTNASLAETLQAFADSGGTSI